MQPEGVDGVLTINRAGDRAAAPSRPKSCWVFDAPTDTFIALCWIPVFLVATRVVDGGGPFGHMSLARLTELTLLLSFMHQPLTLGFVYADGRQFAQRRSLFVLAPVVAVAVALIAVHWNLWIAVPLAAIWNTVHTLQQRYGLSRIYSRKAGYGSAFLDRSLVYCWMVAALLLVAANPATTHLLDRVDLGANNDAAVRILADARPYALALFIPVAVLTACVTISLIRQEIQAPRPNPAKWIYQAGSLGLIASIAINPAAGFVAYVAAHAIEYTVVVYRNARTRTTGPDGERTPLGRLAVTRAGRVLYVAMIMGGAYVVHARVIGPSYLVVLYVIGSLHFLYDGVIWKLRRPAVAATFAIPEPVAA